MTTKSIIILLVTVVATGLAQIQCNWNSMNNGGGVMISSNYASAVTINQTAIGSITGSNLSAYLGFWYPGIVTGVMEDKTIEIINPNALVIKLYKAKPNPFRTQTEIRYSLSAQEKVSLFIYDISGRIVKYLVNGNINPGIYSINWNGRNERGQQVSAGVYFYQLKTKDYTKTNKILLTQ
jgi:hypothetical protein